MANSPIQVILNTNDFIEALENKGGGPARDFYAGNDGEFIEHQELLQQQLGEINSMQLVRSRVPVCYGKVVLKQGALAKSHRPTAKLFKSDVAPVVGAGDLGELFVELTPNAITELTQKIGEAETETNYRKNKNGKEEAHPSRLRSEVGSIQRIVPYTESDKQKFSVKEALQWFGNPQSGAYYLVELFKDIPQKQNWDALEPYEYTLFESFSKGLEGLGPGVVAIRLTRGKGTAVIFGIRLEKSNNPSFIQLLPSNMANTRDTEQKDPDLNSGRHGALLKFLGEHPLVKKISLPPVITQSVTRQGLKKGEQFKIPKPDSKTTYPKIGIIDGGVSDIFSDWIEERYDYISSAHLDIEHASFIAGLAITGRAINGAEICKELDGCKIIDLPLLPRQDKHKDYYGRTLLGFFTVLEEAVKELTARTGVRIYNFSLNIEEHASTTGYSYAAQILDKIAEENDVIFIISAGNISSHNDMRKEWPADKFEALKILTKPGNDTIKKPGESCRNISVSAVNPPNMEGIVPFALSNYSCRGPGLRVGLKPDFGHIGGSGTKHPTLGHGLHSIDASGNIIDGCGTSYAAPLVGKTLVCLDHAIEGTVSRETLIGLSVHHAVMPESMNDKKLLNVTKHLIGFGIPPSSDEILNGDPSSITLVFANRVKKGHKMSFKFSWPPSLVRDGKCFGHAKLTVVSTPKFDYRYGAEFVRINIEASLRQMQTDGKYKGRLHAIYTPDDGDAVLFEKDLIEHAFKWSPVKVYEKTFPKGVGPTTDWSLDVEYLARDGVTLPMDGVPFTAILTLSDPQGEKPVFNDMRQMLQSVGVRTADIRTAARVTPRI